MARLGAVEAQGRLTARHRTIRPGGPVPRHSHRQPAGCLILRNADGSSSFAHPSFIDFYVAQRIFDDIAGGDSKLSSRPFRRATRPTW
jgi:hypothetical protein